MFNITSRVKQKILIACIVGFAVYALFNISAMIFYPGGTSVDKDRIGYSFTENFFSDLGMVETYAGQSKTISLLLFASALILIGILLLLFVVVFRSYFDGSKLERYSSRIGSVGGVLAGISCIGIAVTPWDLYLEAHTVFSYILSISFLITFIAYAIAIYVNREYPNTYAVVLVIYMFFLLIFMGLMIFGPNINTSTGLRVLAIGQKIVLYLGMLCIFIQFLGAFFYNRKQDRLPAAKARCPVQAT